MTNFNALDKELDEADEGTDAEYFKKAVPGTSSTRTPAMRTA